MPSEPPAAIRPATPDAIDQAAALLRQGHLVAFPTETVYGLGANACDDRAVAAIFAAKGRPSFNPLIVHVARLADAEALATFNDKAHRLAAAFWPGPLTLVLPRAPRCAVSLLASAGLDSLALRMPRHPIAQALLAASGRPLAAPSANRSGEVSPTTAQHVAQSLGSAAAMILDGGACLVGIESTVLDLSIEPPALLRPGAVTAAQIEAVIGPVRQGPMADTGSAPRPSPGMLTRHYAPHTPLRLEATNATSEEALLAFGPRVPSGAAKVLNLSPRGDLTEAAANLFAMLRNLDAGGFAGIAAMPIPERELGVAINDRLRRAAAPDMLADEAADGAIASRAADR
jgi:L-threonylcarbamoyladenylate synthase